MADDRVKPTSRNTMRICMMAMIGVWLWKNDAGDNTARRSMAWSLSIEAAERKKL